MDNLDFITETMDEFTVIGFEREFAFDQGYQLIPKYWDEITQISKPVLCQGKKPETEIEKAICENRIGEFGVCIDEQGQNTFRYMIAGRYKGGAVPEGMKLLGYSTSKDSKVIKYQQNQKIDLTSDIDLYMVVGTAKVIYESEGELVTVGMSTEDLGDYNLPTPDEVGLEAPTYFVKVDKTSPNAKEVVPDEVKEALEGQIRLADAKAKAGENETIEVGDSVEELEKVFDGWQTKETDEEGNETLVDVDENYKPEDNTDNELVAKWKEQDKTNEDTTVLEDNSTEGETTELTIERDEPVEETELTPPVVETPIETETNL